MQVVVYTGDLVGSEALGADGRELAFAALNRAAAAISRWPDAQFRVERFRGDGWQAMLTGPRFALRAALVLRASIRSLGRDFDTRLSVALGSAVDDDRPLADHAEPVFVASGRGLDHMPAKQRMVCDLQSTTQGLQPEIVYAVAERPMVDDGGVMPPQLLAACFHLADALVDGWTPRQSELLAVALSPLPVTQQQLAEAFGIQQQSVQKALTAGALAHLESALAMLERERLIDSTFQQPKKAVNVKYSQ
ncbi:hypothetical protein OAS86_05260 [Gammaproteobacteria bacterium]|nr:hypothetical protein [Gammaproteobacteria bacterium]